jgi:hypothetical protein
MLFGAKWFYVLWLAKLPAAAQNSIFAPHNIIHIPFYINFTGRVFYPIGNILSIFFKIVIYMSLYSMPSTLKNVTFEIYF